MMYTFDNALTISFLFRDTMIGFTTGGDTLPAIYPITPANKPAPSENKQFLVTLGYDLLEVSTCLIKEFIGPRILLHL